MDLDMRRFFLYFVKGTAYKAVVIDRMRLMCRLSQTVADALGMDRDGSIVNVSSRCVKHIFDKRPAEEFLFVLDHAYDILKSPDRIYADKGQKRESFAFVKNMAGYDYFCAIEKTAGPCEIATVFRLRDPKYLSNYALLWSRKDGVPSS